MRRIFVALGVLVAVFVASSALAHGPTVKLAYTGLDPSQLTIQVGQTVHFHNTSRTPRTFTVRAEDGSFESPPLGRAEGFHHSFETPGSHAYAIVESGSKGEIVVVPVSSD